MEAYYKAEQKHLASRQVLATSTAEGDSQIKHQNDLAVPAVCNSTITIWDDTLRTCLKPRFLRKLTYHMSMLERN
ncbi:hypothetical protein DPMN_028177 [Dreissena polymorpha]|uniref:Uncharacterized protein n=1 Tax=Dreissena polymorpha TaxID=45954 RepID=A0A9D4RF29_DREPO|nr:hypothetical protein DPMN_028177 [Dreissena polymorpha]